MNILMNQLQDQQNKVQGMLRYCNQRVPHYLNSFNKLIRKDEINLTDWLSIPFTNKKQIQQQCDDFTEYAEKAISSPGVKVQYTSGSTGKPLKILHSEAELTSIGKKLWSTRNKYHPGIMSWRLLTMSGRRESQNQSSMYVGPDLSYESLTTKIKDIESFNPQWIQGAPSAICRLAQFCLDSRLKLHSVKSVEMTGEFVDEMQRLKIWQAFNCSIHNHYGSREFWVMSYECPMGHLHAWTDNLIFEAVRDDQSVADGEIGELVVTSLSNFIMPLIRYKIGDLVRIEHSHCACGNRSPILTPVGGRVTGMLITKEREIYAGVLRRIFINIAKDLGEAVNEYQIVQLDYSRVLVKIIPGKLYSPYIQDRIRLEISDLLPEMDTSFEICYSIESDVSGKTREFVSWIPEVTNENK